jgi:hypothetical protein
MNHIQKSLLASAARKIIPFQMMKTNYGFSSADANDLEGVTSTSVGAAGGVTTEVLGLQIQNLPLEASFVAIALRVPAEYEKTQELQVAFLATAPLGEDTIRLPLQPGQRYYVYVLSNKYKDGYITSEDTLVEAFNIPPGDGEGISTDNRRIFETGGPTDELIVEQLILEETTPEAEWYPYDGEYTRPDLLWADPTPLFRFAEGVAPESSYSYLAYQRSWLSELQEDFTGAFDLQGAFGAALLGNLFHVTRQNFIGGLFSQWNVTNFSLNQAIRAMKARTHATQTYDKWKEDQRIIESEPAQEMLDNFKQTDGYDPNQSRLIGNAPTDKNLTSDPAPEYQMNWALENQIAGLAVVLKYIVHPYNALTANLRPFGSVFSNDGAPIGSDDTEGGNDFWTGWLDLIGDLLEDRFDSWLPGEGTAEDQYDNLTDAVLNRVAANLADGSAESVNPILFEDGNSIYARLIQILSANQDDKVLQGRRIVALVAQVVAKYKSARGIGGRAGQGTYERYWLDPFDSSTKNGEIQYWEFTRVGRKGKDIYASAYDQFCVPKILETDRIINELGDFTFFPPPEDDGQPQLAHEATLQNIRFLRNMLEETRDDLWAQGSSLNSFIVSTLVQLRDEVIGNLSRTNSITNITSANQVANSELEVLIRNISIPDAAWSGFQGNVLELNNGLKAIDVSHLKNPGQYVIAVRPKGIEIGIPHLDPLGGGIINTPDLNDYQSKNYFYGWNIEFRQAGDNGVALGEQRMIVGSKFQVNNHMLLISPTIDSRPDFQENILGYIWPNTFIPVMIDLELTEHNHETLAYANYAKREFNTKTGVLRLYRFDGTIYKEWTIGERTMEEEGYADIEFRDPIVEGEDNSALLDQNGDPLDTSGG